jgi:hypothetical protein
MFGSYLHGKGILQESMGDITPAEWAAMKSKDSDSGEKITTDEFNDAKDIVDDSEDKLTEDDLSDNPILENMCNISHEFDTCFILTENAVLALQGKMLEVKAILESAGSDEPAMRAATAEGKDTMNNGPRKHLANLIARIKEMISNIGQWMKKVIDSVTYFFTDAEKWANGVSASIPDYCKGFVYSGFRWDMNSIKVESISQSVFKSIESILPYKTKDGMADAIATYKSNEWSPANIRSKFMKDAGMDHSKDLSAYMNFVLRGKMDKPVDITSFSVMKPKDMIGTVRSAKTGLLQVTKDASDKLIAQLEKDLHAWESGKDGTSEQIEYITTNILLFQQAISFVNTVTLLKVNAIKTMTKEYMRAINGLVKYKPESNSSTDSNDVEKKS